MKNFFLTSKHWQLFLASFGIYFGSSVLFVLPLFYSENTRITGLLWAMIWGFFMFLYLSWFYYLIRGLNKKIHSHELKTKTSNLRFFLIFPIVFVFVLLYYFPTEFYNLTNEKKLPVWIFAVFAVYLFWVFCVFYLIYQAAKTIKTAEIQKKVGFSDFAGEFFLLWFSPIGVWFLQPKINKLARKSAKK